jgi:hypothetical protein
MSLDKNVLVFSDDPCTAIWDGKDYELGAEPVEVKRGIAEHWSALHPDIRIEELPTELIEQRTPENPLEQNNRGGAFPGLKKEEDEETLAIRAKAKELGIKNSHNMKITKLQALIDEAVKTAEQEQKTGDQ